VALVEVTVCHRVLVHLHHKHPYSKHLCNSNPSSGNPQQQPSNGRLQFIHQLKHLLRLHHNGKRLHRLNNLCSHKLRKYLNKLRNLRLDFLAQFRLGCKVNNLLLN
jgi:hypothetical protein